MNLPPSNLSRLTLLLLRVHIANNWCSMSDVWKESEFSELENSAGCAGPEVQSEIGWWCLLLVDKEFVSYCGILFSDHRVWDDIMIRSLGGFFIVNCCVLEWRNLKIIFWTNNSVSSYTSQSICSSVKTPHLRYRRIKARRQLALTIGEGKKETIERICTRSCLHSRGIHHRTSLLS